MTMRWIAQASARGGEQSIISLVTSTWSCPAIFSGQRSIFLNGALFSKTIFYFFGK
jgi:hypothetical protein